MVFAGYLFIVVLLQGLAAQFPFKIGISETVNTNSGPVFGLDIANTKLFYDIPYAKPPIGNLRFAKPQPVDPWTTPFNATTRRNICKQGNLPGAETFIGYNFTTSEDCLTLSVFTPSLSSQNPVMVFIHGGGFIVGAGNQPLYDGGVLAGTKQVVVVAMNYRLGVLGFLSFGNDTSAPGNAALYDQLEALKWVQSNIRLFGGDPSQVTIFGESAGAWSVGLHMLSPLSWPYFTKSILQSGAPVDNSYYVVSFEEAAERARKLAISLGCSDSTSSDMLQCLRSIDASLLVSNVMNQDYIYAVIDGNFLPGVPKTLLKQGRFKSGPLLAGFTKNEGTILVDLMIGGSMDAFGGNYSDTTPTITTSHFSALFNGIFKSKPLAERDAIRFFYVGQNLIKSTYFESLSDIYGDAVLTCPTVQMASDVSLRENVYVYRFEYVPHMNFFPAWYGVAHGIELPMVFGVPLLNPSYSDTDKSVSQYMMNVFTDFAKTGSPPSYFPRFQANPIVEASSPAQFQQYLAFTAEGTTEVRQGPFYSRCKLWNSYLPSLSNAVEFSHVTERFFCANEVDRQLSCPNSGLLKIQSALYGRSANSNICPQTSNDQQGESCFTDVSPFVTNVCHLQSSCTVPQSFPRMFSACHNADNYLHVKFYCI